LLNLEEKNAKVLNARNDRAICRDRNHRRLLAVTNRHRQMVLGTVFLISISLHYLSNVIRIVGGLVVLDFY